MFSWFSSGVSAQSNTFHLTALAQKLKNYSPAVQIQLFACLYTTDKLRGLNILIWLKKIKRIIFHDKNYVKFNFLAHKSNRNIVVLVTY